MPFTAMGATTFHFAYELPSRWLTQLGVTFQKVSSSNAILLLFNRQRIRDWWHGRDPALIDTQRPALSTKIAKYIHDKNGFRRPLAVELLGASYLLFANQSG